MRTRERERFLRLHFTEEELSIRNKLYKARKNAKYKMRITEEHYNKKRKFVDGEPPYDNYLGYFSDHPEDGMYIDTVYFSTPHQYENILNLYEGMFYELFDISNGKRIGYGSLDPDSPVEEIRSYENKTCCGVCSSCFYHGMLYDETENFFDGEYYCHTCYNENK